MDTVLIEGLALEAVIGVYAWEQQIHQRLLLDLELGCDITRAARDDELAATLDYAAISKRLGSFCREHRFELAETYAERMATLLQQEFGVAWLRLTLRKPGAVADAAFVGVRIERGRREQ
ncbi:dihydroneopterin aldolase [Kushneria sinocarnis]|uniref:7,8-dihydroneopterin aldolase n=1 Tax=Kushneria sinocarnis TaxID=595502 RepID=A0A420WZ82_9GAMM|nr:dihydroneopterin aldolase [Kushneria sinocarnis]RKR06590.1 dihydroneopterin aldolase [Kushneria sinocarnis]